MDLKVPLRLDGVPNLMETQENITEFILINGLENKTLTELIGLNVKTAEHGLLDALINKRRSEVANKLIEILVEEELTIKEAISLLQYTERKIENIHREQLLSVI